MMFINDISNIYDNYKICNSETQATQSTTGTLSSFPEPH